MLFDFSLSISFIVLVFYSLALSCVMCLQMLHALKAVQGKRHLRMRMEKSFKLLRERNEDSKDHYALTQVTNDMVYEFTSYLNLTCVVVIWG